MFYTFTMFFALMFNASTSTLPNAPVTDRLPRIEEGKPDGRNSDVKPDGKNFIPVPFTRA